MPRALLCAAALLVASQFVARGVVDPLRNAFVDAGSHYDFRPYYFAAHDLRLGANPYAHERLPSEQVAAQYGLERTGGEVYAPIVVGLYIPLAMLDFAVAKAVWLAFNVALVILAIPLLLRVAGGPLSATNCAAMTVVVMGFEPLVRGLSIGQANVPILVLLCLGSLALARGCDVAAGAGLALAAVYKPIPAIVFAGLVLRRRWRAVAAGLVVALAAAGLSVGLFGHATFVSFLGILAHIGRKWTFWFANQSLAGAIGRALVNNEFGTSWTNLPAVARALWLAANLALLATACRLTLRRTAAHPTWTVSLWLVVGLLISPRSWDHYLAWALIPFVVVAAEVLRTPRPPALGALALTYALLAFPGMYWARHSHWTQGALLLLTNSQTYGLLLLFGLLVRSAPPPPARPAGGGRDRLPFPPRLD